MSANPKHEASLLDRAHRVLPGGTFGNTPADVIIADGKGTRVHDTEGHEYIDYLLGSGPMIVGHGHPEVNAAVEAQLARGTTFFANNPQGIELAEVIADAMPCADKVRFASTGSEADAFAIRIARAYTGRSKILKFEGGYHGYSDYGLMSLAPKIPSNSARPVPDSAGIPDSVADDVVIAPYNDTEAVAALIRENKGEIAAVFMEPVQRLIPPKPGFLESMRELTTANDILLVFDEVVTGFRMAYGGAQAYYDVTPDLCTLGKAIGGGFPLSAIAGRDEVMSVLDRERSDDEHFVPQVGTLSGNPIAAAAGIATLTVLARPGTYERYHEVGNQLMSALDERLKRHGFDAQVLGVPPMFDAVFAGGDLLTYRDVKRHDASLLTRMNGLLRQRGILKGDHKYYVSVAHDERDVEETVRAWDESLAEMARS